MSSILVKRARSFREYGKLFPLLYFSLSSLFDYVVPINLSYFWNWGMFALFALIIQIISGIFLAFNYMPHPDLAFNSVDFIMREVFHGWFLRFIHANGASWFFFVIIIHMYRGLYFSSFLKPRENVWFLGVVLYVLLIVTAFVGYVLPWGQMSYWAAIVITNLVTALPVVGLSILQWLWGGFSIGASMLSKFFCFHFILPFVILAISMLHIWVLHQYGSSNSLSIESKLNIKFAPYFIVKDFAFFFFIYALFFMLCCFSFMGYSFLHVDNMVLANATVTPHHIQPEWYFLFYYGILRIIPHKLFGICLLLFAILIWFIIPRCIRILMGGSRFRPLYFGFCVSVFGSNINILYAGLLSTDLTSRTNCYLSLVYFFSLFFIVFPNIHNIEHWCIFYPFYLNNFIEYQKKLDDLKKLKPTNLDALNLSPLDFVDLQGPLNFFQLSWIANFRKAVFFFGKRRRPYSPISLAQVKEELRKGRINPGLTRLKARFSEKRFKLLNRTVRVLLQMPF